MKTSIKSIITALFFLSLFQAEGLAANVIIIKSQDIAPYTAVSHSFRDSCDFSIQEYTLDSGSVSTIRKELNRGPDLVLTIGLDALEFVKDLQNLPVIYTMVSNPAAYLDARENITGVSMNVSAEKQLRVLLRMKPETKTIGIVYDPRRTADLFQEVAAAAQRLGIGLRRREVSSPRDVPTKIDEMLGEIDAFWLLPDPTVISRESLDFLLLKSFERQMPVITFSEKYVEMGFLLSISFDAKEIGAQACEIASSVLRGTDTTDVLSRPPEHTSVSVNVSTAQRLGLSHNLSKIQKSFDALSVVRK
jgi:putative ABC transport system substrate-binding protein